MYKLERRIIMFNDNIDEEFKIDNDQVMSPDEYRVVTDPPPVLNTSSQPLANLAPLPVALSAYE